MIFAIQFIEIFGEIDQSTTCDKSNHHLLIMCKPFLISPDFNNLIFE